MRHAAELELLDLIESSPTCHSRKIYASLGEKFGILITFEGNPVGVWVCIHGALNYHSLASYEFRVVAINPDAALVATIKMAESRNWTR